jgi:hypothetical protein
MRGLALPAPTRVVLVAINLAQALPGVAAQPKPRVSGQVVAGRPVRADPICVTDQEGVRRVGGPGDLEHPLDAEVVEPQLIRQ